MELTLYGGPAGNGTRRYTLANGETIIGRRPDCRIVLDAPSISARHARLFTVDGHAVIHGLEEAWPVYVNGEPVKRRVLAAGDDIELGPYRLRYTDGGIAAAVDPGPETAPDTAPDTDPDPIEPGPAATREAPDPVADDGADVPAGSSPTGGVQVDAAPPPEQQPAEPVFVEPPPESVPVASAFPDPEPETAETVDRDHAGADGETADPTDTDAAPADGIEPAFEDTVIEDPEPAEPDRLLPVEAHPDGAGEAPLEIDDRDSAYDDVAPQAAPMEDESERAGGFHLDILTGINRGRRVSLTNDLVVLGFNQVRLVEIRNDDGALSLRRLDDGAAAELNGVPMTAEPREALPDDVISLQRIEMRIHRDRP